MITTSTVLTLSLAKAMGVYMIAGGISGLLARGRWAAIIENFRDKAGLTYACGIFVYVFGVVMIMAHNIWTDPVAIFVTLFGWAAAVEGLVVIIYPAPIFKLADSLMRPGFIRAFAIFAIAFGALLLWAGLTGTAGAA